MMLVDFMMSWVARQEYRKVFPFQLVNKKKSYEGLICLGLLYLIDFINNNNYVVEMEHNHQTYFNKLHSYIFLNGIVSPFGSIHNFQDMNLHLRRELLSYGKGKMFLKVW